MLAYPKGNSHIARQKAKMKAVLLFIFIAISAMSGAMLQVNANNSAPRSDVAGAESSQNVQDVQPSGLLSVEPGDTLLSIAEKYRPDGVGVKQYMRELMEFNGMDAAKIQAGQVLKLP